MALTLIKEDGSGKQDANSYAEVADADGYFEGHLYAGTWLGTSVERKGVALVMASRLLDGQYQFTGARTTTGQALQWPRQYCPDPDRFVTSPAGLCPRRGWLENDLVPQAVVAATCELARELLLAERTAPPPGEGIDSVQLAHASSGATGSSSDSSSTKYSKSDTPPIIPRYIQSMLAKYGTLLSARSGQVRLVRV